MCPHMPAQQKGECASARDMCSGTSARNIHTTPDPTPPLYCRRRECGLQLLQRFANGGSEGTPRTHSAQACPHLPPPSLSPNCSDEPSTYLDSRHDTSVADSSRSLGCGSEQLPPNPPAHPRPPPLPLPWRGDDDSNCMYYTTTCNPMGHGSIGLTLSGARTTPARPPARLAFARAASHHPLRG